MIPMSQGFTSPDGAQHLYGGTMFFVFLFVALIFHTGNQDPERSKAAEITACRRARQQYLGDPQLHRLPHLLGEGHFAPELGNV